jgi:hypothetical protein
MSVGGERTIGDIEGGYRRVDQVTCHLMLRIIPPA